MDNESTIIKEKYRGYYIEVWSAEFDFEHQWQKTQDMLYGCISQTDGYKNTVQMYLHGNELADCVLHHVIDGKDDWYIPAIDELVHIYKHTNNDRLFGDTVWSSTEYKGLYTSTALGYKYQHAAAFSLYFSGDNAQPTPEHKTEKYIVMGIRRSGLPKK